MSPSTTRFKDHASEQQLFQRRALAAAIVMTVAVGLVIARLVWLQVVKYDYFVELAQGNRIKLESIPPNRGLILDRNGIPLATNAPSYQLELTREQVPDLDDTLSRLATLGLVEKDKLATLKRDIRRRRAFEAVPLRLQMNEVELAKFAARQHEFAGVEIRPRLTRYYPLGVSGVHAIGYVGAIGEEDEKRLKMDDYAGITLTGKSGVERSFEQDLRGTAGVQQLLVNARGRSVERIGRDPVELARTAPVAGNDVYLTIDQHLQTVAEEAVRGQRASIVAIDPSNGDVLAFVSTPAFDPNMFVRGLTREQYLELTEDPDRPMYDRAIRGVYPPGSTVKPMMALAALEIGIVTPEDTRFCRGTWSSPGYGRIRRDWEPRGHGVVNMRKALATSCDPYFFDMARLMGIDRMAGYLSRFGVGAPTGIDIEGERIGILPSTQWKRRAFKRKEQQLWFPGDTISVGIGQGQLQMTPIQLAHVAATLAARGQRFQPRLVRAVRDSQTGNIRDIPPRKLPPVTPSDPAAWDVVLGGMFDVANAPYGSARAAMAKAPYKVAGKSGTVQVFTVAANERVRKAHELDEHLRDHALFIAFAPADAPMPKIAVTVVVENAPRGGSIFAAPIARRVLDAYLLSPEQWTQQETKLTAVAGAAPAGG